MSILNFGRSAAAAVSLVASGMATAKEEDFRGQGQAEQKVSQAVPPITKEQTNAAASISLAMVQLGILSGGPEKQIIGGKEVSIPELQAEVRKNYPLLSESQKTMLTKGFPGLSDIAAGKNVQNLTVPGKEQKESSLSDAREEQAETPLTGRQQSAGISIGLAMINIRLMKDIGQEKMLSGGREVSIYEDYEVVRQSYPLLSKSQQENFNKEYPELSDIIAGKIGQKPAEIKNGQVEAALTEVQQSAGVSVQLAMINIRLMKDIGQEKMLAGGQEVSIQEYYADVRKYYPLLSKSQQENFQKEYPEISRIIDGTIEQSGKDQVNLRIAEQAEKIQKAAYADCVQNVRLAFLAYEPDKGEQGPRFSECVKQFNESFNKLTDNLKDKLEKEAFDTPYQDALKGAQQKVQDQDLEAAQPMLRKVEILNEFNLIFKAAAVMDRIQSLDAKVDNLSERAESLGKEIDERK